MGILHIEQGKGTEAGRFWLCLRTRRLQEIIGAMGTLSDQDMRELGLVPIEELYCDKDIEGYAELGKTLYGYVETM
jgi:hypothetical protein